VAVGLRAGPGNGGEYPLASTLRLTFNGKARASSMGGHGFPDFHLLLSADFGRPETITRWSSLTVLTNRRSKLARALPGRKCRFRERR
jgi:hypothetical protein